MAEESAVHILINAANITASGPQAVVLNLLPSLLRVMGHCSFTLLFPDKPCFRTLALKSNDRAIFIQIKDGAANDLNRLRQLFWELPRLAKRIAADVCLTLGDLGPIFMSCPQVLFLHQALLVHSEKELRSLSAWPLPKRIYMRWHFAKSVRRAAAIIVQTPVMTKRVINKYHIDLHKITEIAQPVPQHILNKLGVLTSYAPMTECGKKIRLLFLASYYKNKNHEILPAVVEELRCHAMDQDVQIFVTLDESQESSADIRRQLRLYPDVITNLGALPPEYVAQALRTSTALFIPSLSESYGLIFLEAMACGVPILTSNLDFAHWMCKDLALYFDPLNANDIVQKIASLNKLQQYPEYTTRALQRLNDFPKDWDEVAESFWRVLKKTVENHKLD